MSNSTNSHTTVVPSQVKMMESIKDEWWDLNGFARCLHDYNNFRVPFVRDGLLHNYNMQKKLKSEFPLEGLKILDIGCGGGIFTEALAKLGAKVDGVDASDDLLNVARNHAALDPKISANIRYIHSTIEDFSIENTEMYDGVVASEIIEHIENKELFVENCLRPLKPGGSIYFTTFNKTWSSWLMAIILAEYIMKLIPKGTHEWELFISPEDLSKRLKNLDCNTTLVKGLSFDIFNSFHWYWTTHANVGYCLKAIKNK